MKKIDASVLFSIHTHSLIGCIQEDGNQGEFEANIYARKKTAAAKQNQTKLNEQTTERAEMSRESERWNECVREKGTRIKQNNITPKNRIENLKEPFLTTRLPWSGRRGE